jgi:hypothetical protein
LVNLPSIAGHGFLAIGARAKWQLRRWRASAVDWSTGTFNEGIDPPVRTIEVNGEMIMENMIYWKTF